MIALDLEYLPEGSVDGSIAPARRDLRDIYCEIMQIGAVRLNKGGEEIASLDLLIRPSFITYIPEWHVDLVGITEQDRVYGVPFQEGVHKLIEFIGDDPDVWVFYGDVWVLKNSLRQHTIELTFPDLQQLKPLLATHGITQELFNEKGLEFCSGNLHKILDIHLPSDSTIHNALHDARSLGHAVHALTRTH